MEKGRGIRNISIAALLVAVVGLSIGFAALSQTLSINGTTTAKGNVWSIIFANATNTTSAAATNSGKITSGPTLGGSSTTLDFAVDLVKPGDEASFTVDVKNAGQIDANVTSIDLTGVTEALAKNITYTVEYVDGAAIAVGDTLVAGASKTLKVTVTYNADATVVLTEDVVLSLTAQIVYGQA